MRKLNDAKKFMTPIIIGAIIVLLGMVVFSQKETTLEVVTEPDGKTISLKIKKDGTVEEPEVIEKEGYRFLGFFNGDELWDFSKKAPKGLKLVAKYEKLVSYKVSFDTAGGSKVEEQTVYEGRKVSKPTNPTREGYTFEGWSVAGISFDFDQEIDKDVTLTAVWKKVEESVVVTPKPTPVTGENSKPVDPVVVEPVFVDKTKLEQVKAKAIKEEEYTVTTFALFKAALLLTESTQAEVNAKVTAIELAIQNLVFINQADLDVLKNHGKEEARYTVASFAALTNALSLPEAAYQEIANKITAITYALENLVIVVMNEEELTDALISSYQEIFIGNDIVLTDNVVINRAVTISGIGSVINYGFVVMASHVTIKDITVESAAGYGIQAYQVENVLLNQVTIMSSAKGGVLVNGAEVTVRGGQFVSNTWGGIEVSQGLDVIKEPQLTVEGSPIFTGMGYQPFVWIDGKTTNENWVTISGYYEIPYTIHPNNDTLINQVWFVKEASVKNEAQLLSALYTNVPKIAFRNNIILSEVLNITRPVTIEGNLFDIIAPSISGAHGIIVSANDVIIRNLIVTEANGYGVQIYRSTNVLLDNMLIMYSGKGAVLVNGSQVVVDNISLLDNAWGGIEVSQGSDVPELPELTIQGTIYYEADSSKPEAPVIWIDGKTTNDGWVIDATETLEENVVDNQVWFEIVQ